VRAVSPLLPALSPLLLALALTSSLAGPIWSLQAHLVHGFASGLWLAIDATHYEGGRTASNGIENDDPQSNGRLGLTVAVPINRRQSVKISGSSGVATRTGTDFDALAVAWQDRWGGGI
jgi:hypothetical protein